MKTLLRMIMARTTSNSLFPVFKPSCTASFPYAACRNAKVMFFSLGQFPSHARARVLRSYTAGGHHEAAAAHTACINAGWGKLECVGGRARRASRRDRCSKRGMFGTSWKKDSTLG